MACAKAVNSVLSRSSTSLRFSVTPCLQRTPCAVGEQLPRGRHPERVHRVPLVGDEGSGHHVEVTGRPGLEEGRPARRPGIEGVHEHVAGGIKKRTRIGPHLVVDDAALSPRPDLSDEVGDQHGLARAGGARDDGVLGLGALRPGDSGDAAGGTARGREHRLRQAHCREVAHASATRGPSPFPRRGAAWCVPGAAPESRTQWYRGPTPPGA